MINSNIWNDNYSKHYSNINNINYFMSLNQIINNIYSIE